MEVKNIYIQKKKQTITIRIIKKGCLFLDFLLFFSSHIFALIYLFA